MSTTAIIDYGAGNLQNVQNAAAALGYAASITRDRDEILSADRIILPGVGAFGSAMAQLKREKLDQVIYDAIERQIPFLGICLGLQAVSYTHLDVYKRQLFDQPGGGAAGVTGQTADAGYGFAGTGGYRRGCRFCRYG